MGFALITCKKSDSGSEGANPSKGGEHWTISTSSTFSIIDTDGKNMVEEDKNDESFEASITLFITNLNSRGVSFLIISVMYYFIS